MMLVKTPVAVGAKLPTHLLLILAAFLKSQRIYMKGGYRLHFAKPHISVKKMQYPEHLYNLVIRTKQVWKI